MPSQIQRARPGADLAARQRAALIERRLSNYRSAVQPRVRRLASVHPWIADLAISFPALLFALAYPGKRAQAQASARLVAAGAPLPHAAALAGAPLWLRSFPAEAFATPLPALPDNPDFRRRIANHPPANWISAPRWIENVALAAQCADEDVAVWFAREAPLKDKKERRFARRPRDRRRLVALWAWFSRREDAQAHAFDPHAVAARTAMASRAHRGPGLA